MRGMWASAKGGYGKAVNSLADFYGAKNIPSRITPENAKEMEKLMFRKNMYAHGTILGGGVMAARSVSGGRSTRRSSGSQGINPHSMGGETL
jgi:hypothetical protein